MAIAGQLSRRALWMRKLSDEVARGIAEKIRSGALTTGMPLPDRTSLTAEFVTSDGVVDRAVETLVDNGLVIRESDGVLRISGFPAREEGFAVPHSDQATLDDVIAILELRIGIECEAAALAAQRRTEEQMEAIRAALAHFEDPVTGETTPGRADFIFHRTIGEASGNRYFQDLVEYLGPLFIPRMRVAFLAGERAEGDANLGHARAEHRDIVAAIERQDPEGARQAMRRHLDRTLALMRNAVEVPQDPLVEPTSDGPLAEASSEHS